MYSSWIRHGMWIHVYIHILKTGGYEQQENRYPSTFPTRATTTTFNSTKYQTQNNSLASATDITEMYSIPTAVCCIACESSVRALTSESIAEQQQCGTVLYTRESERVRESSKKSDQTNKWTTNKYTATTSFVAYPSESYIAYENI